ncbi:MAG: hypothetical protein NVS3B10_22530 [Polyangiales bacterium]
MPGESMARSVSLSLVLAALTMFAGCGGKGADDAPPADDAAPDAAPAPDTGSIGVVDSGTPRDSAPLPPRDSGPPDTGPEVDRGGPSDVYPAFKGALPQLSNNGGYVMKAPTVVTVTWPGDKNVDRFEAFGDTIGATDYWKAITSEYGVAPAVSGAPNHMRITDPAPASLSNTDVDAFVAAQIGDLAKSKWPAPKDDSLYVLYLSSATRLQYRGSDACSVIGGYHTSTSTALGDVSYAVIPYCRGFSGDYFESMTAAASHELGEAATDPQPGVRPGYVGFDGQHLAWELFQDFLVENGDSCTIYDDAFFTTSESTFSYKVQRQWSNVAAAGTHDPCVPAASSAPYFTVVPQALEAVVVDMSSYGGSNRQRTKGYTIAVGETRRIEVGLVSDGPMSAWTIDVAEGNPIPGYGYGVETGNLTASVLGRNSGQNGEKVTIEVKVNSRGKIKGELVTVISSDASGAHTHYAPILISTP